MMSTLPWIAAFLLGALAPAALFAAISGKASQMLPLAFAVTIGHALILGVPVALLYRWKRWKRLWAAVASAALIGMIPVGILTWPLDPSSRGWDSVNDVVQWVDGIPTLAGWISYAELLAWMAVLGAIGGLIFWLTLRCCGLIPGDAQTSFRPRLGLLLASLAVAASGSVAALPMLSADRSCHNVFRDGQRSVSAVVNIDLDIVQADWRDLAKLLEQFGQSRQMSFRDLSQSQAPTVDMLYLSLCAEDSPVISIDEQHWHTDRLPPSNRGVGVRIYDPRGGHDWPALARELVAALDGRWSGKVRFRDYGGRLVPAPSELSSPRGAPPG
ncbi:MULTISPECIES: hypothetical protein [unclassified Bradyrhizobium]|uniref:hypothetical protein n=1 Tax=unclassified Bradyrhizobium TaxID=2631580 RepID=UPI002916A322|nr:MULTISPECIES: hypothetical protein [unclassified Bradyrhizobium]